MEKAALAIGELNGKRVAVSIPAVDIVKLIVDPSHENEEMVDVLWKGRAVSMYTIDLKLRGIETQKT